MGSISSRPAFFHWEKANSRAAVVKALGQPGLELGPGVEKEGELLDGLGMNLFGQRVSAGVASFGVAEVIAQAPNEPVG